MQINSKFINGSEFDNYTYGHNPYILRRIICYPRLIEIFNPSFDPTLNQFKMRIILNSE